MELRSVADEIYEHVKVSDDAHDETVEWIMRQIDALIALVRAEHTQEIARFKAHWFTQGGTARFGAIEGDTADELVSSILALRDDQGWEPIETAKGRTEPFLVYWSRSLMGGPEIEMLGDWREYLDVREMGEPEATHWMPLPSPPAVGHPKEPTR